MVILRIQNKITNFFDEFSLVIIIHVILQQTIYFAKNIKILLYILSRYIFWAPRYIQSVNIHVYCVIVT